MKRRLQAKPKYVHGFSQAELGLQMLPLESFKVIIQVCACLVYTYLTILNSDMIYFLRIKNKHMTRRG